MVGIEALAIMVGIMFSPFQFGTQHISLAKRFINAREPD